MAKLKDICDVDWGNTTLTKSAYIDDGEYLGVSAAGCDGRMDYYDFDAYTPVISAIGANCGKLFLPEEPFVAIKNTITLKPHVGLDGKYLYYALVNNKIPKRGGGQPFIGKGDTEEYEITVPDIGTQLEIVKRVEKICKIISYREREIDKLDELIKARFVECFGGCKERRKLSEYAELITKGASPRWQGVEYNDNEEGTLFVTSENVREGYIDYSKKKYLPNTINEILPRSVLKRNDVLVNIVNASIGRAAIYESDELANINQAVALVRLRPGVLNVIFLLTFLNSDEAIRSYDRMKVGGDKANLSLKNISDLMVPDVSLEAQNKFADYVKQVDKSKVVVQRSLDETQKLFDGLMQEYFG